MPELAEVHYYSRQWAPGVKARVLGVSLHPKARVFRNAAPSTIVRSISHTRFIGLETHGKQMLFRFSGGAWLTVHLGMTGELLRRIPGTAPAPHEHLILHQMNQDLVFRDPRMFGEVKGGHSPSGHPPGWKDLPPQTTDRQFTLAWVRQHLCRHARAPLKAVLLRQECFPGIGNWMADEILWRAALHPGRPGGTLTPQETILLHHQTVAVSRDALRVIGKSWKKPPNSWLFNHRWKDGGRCPESGCLLVRETIAGRTTCWSPARQSPSA